MSNQSIDELKKIEKNDLLTHFPSLTRGIDRLEKLGALCHFPKNTVLNAENAIPEKCYIVKTGRVIAYEFSYTGDQRIYNFLEPGSIVLEECLLFDKRCPVLFKTTEPSDLVVIGKCALKHAFKHDIDVVMDVMESMTIKYLSAMELNRLGPTQGATWQLCRFILTLAEHHSEPMEDGIRITEKISQQTIADLLGMNRVTVTRKLNDLKKLNIIEIRDGHFFIGSLQRLLNYMDAIEYQNT